MVLRGKDAVTEWRVINEETGQKMAYRYLGRTGVKVSVLGYGNMMCEKPGRNAETQALTNLCVKRCWERGINFFDTAEMYNNGESERELGIALKTLGVPRKDYVLVTKVFFGGQGVNDLGLSRKHIIEGAKAGIKRLDTPYVDVIYAHRPDYYTPLEEQVRAFNWLIDQGLAFYWGTSEWPADMIEEACQIAERLGMHAPVTEQPQYNMLVRDRFEKEYKPLFEYRGYGTTIWGANCGGLLTGKYNDGPSPASSRAEVTKGSLVQAFFDPHIGDEDKIQETQRKLKAMAKIAEREGVTQSQLAIAWCLHNDYVSTCLLGFSSDNYIDKSLDSIDLFAKWHPELDKEIDAVFGSPEMVLSWRTWTPEANPRAAMIDRR